MIKEYLHLYYKSLALVYKSSKLITFFMILTIPLQAIIPSLNILLANVLINNLVDAKISFILILVITWGLLFILSNLLIPLNTFLQGLLTDKLTYKLNVSLMEKSKELQSIAYFENSSIFDDIQLISSEASWRPVNLLVFGTSVISNIISLITMMMLLANFSILISLAILIAIIPQGILFYKIQQQAFETLVSNSSLSRKLNYYSNVLLSNDYIKETRLFNSYDFFINKYTVVFNKIVSDIRKNKLKHFIISTIFLFITASISVISFIYVIYGIKQYKFEIGAILVFSTSIIYALQNVSRIVEESSLLYDTLLYMQKYFNFISHKNSFSLGKDKFNNDFKKIEFKNVSFKYENSENYALTDLSFSINKGEKIAIVGENGSGKSTLVKLLLRLYNLENGSIFIDNKDYKEIEINSYRENFSAVFQDFSKYDLSLKENICISNTNNLDIKNIETDIKKVFDKLDIKNKDLDKILGKKFDGLDLSGGQWQKLAIARALFSNKEILILDEPTASLDPKIESKIYQDFLKITENKTVLFITHRLATVKKADKVLVIKNGEFIAFDTHDNLMINCEYYKDLYNLQVSLYE